MPPSNLPPPAKAGKPTAPSICLGTSVNRAEPTVETNQWAPGATDLVSARSRSGNGMGRSQPVIFKTSDDRHLPNGARDCGHLPKGAPGDRGSTRGSCSDSNAGEDSATDDLAQSRPPAISRNARSELFESWPPQSSVVGLGAEALKGFGTGLRCARVWRSPPNWSSLDWREELRAVALGAAWQAEHDHEPSRGVPIELFVISRVKARALTRLRQEWRYALRNLPVHTEMNEALAGADPALDSADSAFEFVAQALGMLSGSEQWLLNQLFWQDRTEANIAAELGISQPAVSKRKRVALFHMRNMVVINIRQRGNI